MHGSSVKGPGEGGRGAAAAGGGGGKEGEERQGLRLESEGGRHEFFQWWSCGARQNG